MLPCPCPTPAPPPPPTPAREPIPYSKAPESAYQANIRGKASQLQDHICKEMNHVNLHRCRWGLPGTEFCMHVACKHLAFSPFACVCLWQSRTVVLLGLCETMQWVHMGSYGHVASTTAHWSLLPEERLNVFDPKFASLATYHVPCCAVHLPPPPPTHTHITDTHTLPTPPQVHPQGDARC
jgi:hypothetical protein